MRSVLIITIITVISSVNSQTFDANSYCSTLASSLYPYPGGTNCTQYLKCFSNGVSMVGAVYTCMGTTLFNPTLLYCQSGYVCVPVTTTTLVPSTTSESSTSTTTPAPTVSSTSTLTSTTISSSTDSSVSESTTQTMQATTTSAAFNANSFCTSQVSGRYPVGTDCTQYVICSSNGVSMMGTVYTCSGPTLFNPAQLYCQLGYVCVPPTTSSSTTSSTTTPVSSSSTVTSTTTLVPSTTTDSSTTSSSNTETQTSTTTSSSTDSTTSAVFDANVFCTSQASGRYAYPTGCISYVYCYVLDDVMIGNVYDCLGTTQFNPQLQYCEDGYTC